MFVVLQFFVRVVKPKSEFRKIIFETVSIALSTLEVFVVVVVCCSCGMKGNNAISLCLKRRQISENLSSWIRAREYISLIIDITVISKGQYSSGKWMWYHTKNMAMFMKNSTRLKTLEHSFWNNLAEFTSRWVWKIRKVHSGISYFT